jgi:hypothetical protein
MVRGWRLLGRSAEADRERIRYAARTLSVFPGDDGMYVVRGRLTPEDGALLMRALEAAGDVLFAREAGGVEEVGGVGGSDASSREGLGGGERFGAKGREGLGGVKALGGAREGRPDAERTPGQRRADALALLAERAMAAGLDGQGAAAGRADRYQVMLHVDHDTLTRGGEEPGRSELEDGTRVSAETSRRIACDASVVEVRHGRDGHVLDVGRRRRTIPPAIRRALEVRDRGCRFPGCGSRFTDAHHVVHWIDGGGTKLDNLVLLCRHHHRLLHEEGFRLEMNPWPGGRMVFYDRRGLPVPERAPAMEAGPRAAEALVRENARRGVRPRWDTASCRWERTEDVPLEVVERAEDAA